MAIQNIEITSKITKNLSVQSNKTNMVNILYQSGIFVRKLCQKKIIEQSSEAGVFVSNRFLQH